MYADFLSWYSKETISRYNFYVIAMANKCQFIWLLADAAKNTANQYVYQDVYTKNT